MRSAVWIGAALGLLTVRLLAGGNVAEAPAPATVQTANAAAALLAGVVSEADPLADAVPAPAGKDAPPAAWGGAQASAPALPERALAAGRAMQVAAVEVQVQAQRRQGAGEEAIYQARATQLPQAELAQLMAMETAEADWRRQMEACRTGSCDSVQGSQGGNAEAYRRTAAPRLTMK